MLLSRLINAFPDTYIIKDGMRIPWFYLEVESDKKINYPFGLYRKPLQTIEIDRRISDVKKLLSALVEEMEGIRFAPPMKKIWQAKLNNIRQGDTYKEVFQGLLDCLTEQTGVSRIGFKTTHMFNFAPTLIDAFPDMRWIGIIRDPRGWYCSTKVSHPYHVFGSARFWNREVDSAFYAANAHPDRFILITFEELLCNSVPTLQKLSDFLEVGFTVTHDWIDNLRLTENDGSPWYPNPSYARSGEKIPVEQQNKRISTDYRILDELPAHRWRTELQAWEKLLLTIMTRKRRKRVQAGI